MCRSGLSPFSARRLSALNCPGVSGVLRRSARASARVRTDEVGVLRSEMPRAGGTTLEAVGRSRATLAPFVSRVIPAQIRSVPVSVPAQVVDH
jgi:hypothetical protein